MHALEQAILETTAVWEHDGVAHGEIRPSIGAVDETFLQRLMLVFVDLASGYLVVEEVARDRTYETWHSLVKDRLKTLGVGVLYLVSDRAKALIKLAETGLDCLSIPDWFHLIQDLVKSYSLLIFRRLKQAQQALNQVREHLATCEASHRGSAEVEHARTRVKARCPFHKSCASLDPLKIKGFRTLATSKSGSEFTKWTSSEAEVKRWQDVRSAYRNHLANLSLILPPWRLLDSTRQSSLEVEHQLQAEIAALETLMETQGLPVKKKALDKVRKQLAGVSALVDFWWQMVRQDLEQVALTPRWKRWIEELLLPLMYWQEQLSRTRCPRRRAKSLQALQAVQTAFETDPFTQRLAPDVLAGWQAWAAEWAKAFQRASSAVEGRNGYLSQMHHHHHRGLPRRRYKVWTVLHNFDCYASDGTTPASRLFRREFPDLFETILSQIDDLPRPRRRNQTLVISD
jgi:hypothetical protein